MNGVDPSTLKIFANVWNKLTSVDGDIVLLSNGIVIPHALLRRSARVPKPRKTLIHRIGPCSLFV